MTLRTIFICFDFSIRKYIFLSCLYILHLRICHPSLGSRVSAKESLPLFQTEGGGRVSVAVVPSSVFCSSLSAPGWGRLPWALPPVQGSQTKEPGPVPGGGGEAQALAMELVEPKFLPWSLA